VSRNLRRKAVDPSREMGAEKKKRKPNRRNQKGPLKGGGKGATQKKYPVSFTATKVEAFLLHQRQEEFSGERGEEMVHGQNRQKRPKRPNEGERGGTMNVRVVRSTRTVTNLRSLAKTAGRKKGSQGIEKRRGERKRGGMWASSG